MGTLSLVHWIVAAVVVLLLFGPKTLSRVGRTAGRGVRSVSNLKKGLTQAPQRLIDEVKRVDPPQGRGE